MLHSARALSRYDVIGADGRIGRGVDSYFDDSNGELRYLVVATSRWLPDKKLLIPVAHLGVPDTGAGSIPVSLNLQEAARFELMHEDLPVSWRMEDIMTRHFGPLESRGGAPASPVHGSVPREAMHGTAAAVAEPGPKLRSLNEVVGYHAEAVDGPMGVAEDFLVNDETWAVVYVVVDTKSWKPGRQVLAPPTWIEAVSWSERRIHFRVSRQKIKTSQRIARGMHTTA